PTSRYSEPFVQLMAHQSTRLPLWIAQGRGSFGRQVVEGTEVIGRRLGLETRRVDVDIALSTSTGPPRCDLFSAGVFEDDAAVVRRVLDHRWRPRAMCSVAAGIRDFARVVSDPAGI